MKEINLERYQKKLKTKLDKERYEHTIGVMYTAGALAMRYEYDVKSAMLAGLMHDCAKCIPNDRKIALCEKHNINITDLERSNPFLLHAKLGAFLVMHKYRIRDKEIISSILNHTTGKPNMELLDKIIFVADYIEPRRDKAPHLDERRKTAFIDIDRVMYEILGDTLEFLKEKAGDIDPITQKAYEYYKQLIETKEDTINE
ncbi:putative HD superfamily hydrolase involved in NAD metabolism [Lachnotalea glycerini]|uniref:bis(5'-nucleosyl)-tetraphosphatase (symmetrical) n=1 Tax=Lachnotalea glycerini TaxID=1763509 RepID=A0A255IM42_9FIRM|nr:bis(5'-nucleosyl)-tetraphosphatase (symmetrical) YqeK [Lachnotalea glycerini]PXV95457.1 putative HD superfamily hydrolase involved in NAD metabolism [Lachnotalea glycerini]RDY32776.1 HD domain-containing protein [Lachnotalea glycerini]